MTSIYEKALGNDFKKLHPMLQKKFGLHFSSLNRASGEGEMVTITGGAFWIRPFLRLLAKDHLLFPERGENIGFSIDNYAYKDTRGREIVSWIRRFYFSKVTRAFDAVMWFDGQPGVIIDDLGKSGRLTAQLSLSVSDRGGMSISSGHTWLNILKRSFKLPSFFSPSVTVYEYFDEKRGQISIRVSIQHKLLGEIISYEGYAVTSFQKIEPTSILIEGKLPPPVRKKALKK